ncbi:hypothetical protein M8997_005180 [Phyllobacterium sp. 21LDTY02-6]|uniref:hypothetical protein n=1 Tax=unclassified Phyllobacterium TaxID=2638441 RepID=UPI002021AF14|nr:MULTISPECIES: hypothetical protein [unclassified Phyllobacterium]MCO4316568.1 hypothetical protein [Phyllobacterium sp. 21LDTY02-6]MCX8280630.1 hypothetical protein [Phyllobacterium sp. 0TCS1.6C]MCX8292793.1 hypothetical protein [Phyllobacterium sp. 0TCS1.6A]
MIYKTLAAAFFSVAMATSAFAQTAAPADPATSKPTGTSEGAMPENKPADEADKTPGADQSGATTGSTATGTTSDSEGNKGGLNCPDIKSGQTTAMSNDSTKPPTRPQDCPTN